MGSEKQNTECLVHIEMDEKSVVRRNAQIEHERKVAIYDLIEGNQFIPVGDFTGPYHLVMGFVDNRIVFNITLPDGTPQIKFELPSSSFRRIIKDYFMVCESYFSAIKTQTPSQIEAIDMGRRGLHNEGAELLQERLEGKVEVDTNTARRLFTLVCVLHIRG